MYNGPRIFSYDDREDWILYLLMLISLAGIGLLGAWIGQGKEEYNESANQVELDYTDGLFISGVTLIGFGWLGINFFFFFSHNSKQEEVFSAL